MKWKNFNKIFCTYSVNIAQGIQHYKAKELCLRDLRSIRAALRIANTTCVPQAEDAPAQSDTGAYGLAEDAEL